MTSNPPTTASSCPQCGTRLSASLGEELCPHCLFGLALSSPEDEAAAIDAAAPTMDLPAGVLASGAVLGERYRIRKLLGRGGMGEVWRAYDLKLRVDVALKSLHTEWLTNERMLETLRQEVRLARQVVSPNVCRVFDLVELDGSELVTMEYVDGTTLLKVLAERAPLDLEEARGIAAQLLAGLEAIHDAGLVHRDLKPENLMLTRAGRVVIMDFGIAKGLAEGQTGTVAGTPGYMAPEQLHGGGGDARADLYSVGVVLAEMVAPGGLPTKEAREAIWQGLHHDPPQVAETPWAAVIRKAVARRPEDRWPSASALARALEEVTLRVAGAETLQPYPGLSSFTAQDAEYFFGREYEIEAVWKKLRHAHLLALIGPSGAGKSSFLRAGLLPAMPAGWTAIVATPGNRPLASLAQALARELTGDPQAIEQLPNFDQPDVAVSLVARWRRRHEQALVVVDQFEELFTLNSPETQQRFAELLGRLALEADARVVVSMRDDFLFHIHAHESLSPVLADLTLLAPPTGAALRRAVVQPALKCGYRFEDDALVDDMIGEVEGERGALPMLAFAAAQLWARRDREQGLLTREAYEQIGGVAGALAQHAETTLERIGQERAPVVRELFRNLVTAQGTRTVRDRDEVLSVFADGDERNAASSVLDALIDARLLTSYDTQADDEQRQERHRIEIVHESLLSNWPRLVRWQTQDTEGAQLRDELRLAAQMWEQHDRSEDLLWTGTAFEELRIWRERYPGGLSAQEESFVSAMTTKATRRKRQRRVAVAAVLTAALAVTGVTSVLWNRSEVARRQALGEARRAEASKLLALAQHRREKDPTEALALATASLEQADSEEARRLALRLLQEGPPALEIAGSDHENWHAAFSPDGHRLATCGTDDRVRLWAEQGGTPLVMTTSESEALQCEWSSNEILVTGPKTRKMDVWKIPEGELLRTIDVGDHPDRDRFTYTNLNRLLIELYAPGPSTEAPWEVDLYSWQLPYGEREYMGRAIPSDVRGDGWGLPVWSLKDYLFVGNGEIRSRQLPLREGDPGRLVGRYENRQDFFGVWGHIILFLWSRDVETGELLRWDLFGDTPEPIQRLERPETLEEGLDYGTDPDGRWIVAEAPGHLQFWDTERWPSSRPLTLRRSGSWSDESPVFHPTGDWVVLSTHARNHLTFWPLSSSWPSIVDGYNEYIRPLAFSPDGRWLATVRSRQDGHQEIQLLPLPGSGEREERLLELPGRAGDCWAGVGRSIWFDLEFDPESASLLAACLHPLAVVVPLDGSAPLVEELPEGRGQPGSGAVSPSGRRLAAALRYTTEQDGEGLWVWDRETGQRQAFPLGEIRWARPELGWAIWDLAFADETTLYTAGAGGVYRRNLETGTSELVLAADSRSLAVFASFDLGAGRALILEPFEDAETLGPIRILELTNGTVREIPALEGLKVRSPKSPFPRNAFDLSADVIAVGDRDGLIYVTSVEGGGPHLLIGHEGPVDQIAISPDGKWIASTGEDNTLRLWPMPDLTKPPLHLLPHDELIAKLRSLTNFRAVRDPKAEGGWAIELDEFPGWKEVPTW